MHGLSVNILIHVSIALGFLYSESKLLAQGYDAHWIFGDGYHIMFEEGEPQLLSNIPGYKAAEGPSVVSNSNGELLYFTNVVNIWNRNFHPLAYSDTFSASGTPVTSSKANGALLLSWPGDTLGRFHAYFAMSDLDNKLYLSKIDVVLDGGLGGLTDSFKYKSVWSQPVAEYLNAVKHANGRDWWIIGKEYGVSRHFMLALFTPNGIEDVEIHDAGYLGHDWGNITFSMDGSLLAMASLKGTCASSPSAVALYSFNRCVGEFSLIDTLLTRSCSISAYGVAFSPDSKRLYYSMSEKPMVFQASLVEGELVDTLIFEFSGSLTFNNIGGNLVLGPDKKIYVNHAVIFEGLPADSLSKYLGVIQNPNAFGLACQYDTFGFFLGGMQNTGFSLPNFANYDLGPLVGSPCDTLSPLDTTQTAIPVFTNPSPTFAVFPSVSDGVFHVTSSISGTVQIMDLYGREWLEEQISERMSFDLQHAPAGVYIVCLYGEKGQFLESRKVVLE